MSPSRWSGKKSDAAIGGTKISLQFVKELASAIPAPCVGAAAGAALELIEILESAKENASDCRELQQRLGNLMVVVMAPLQGKADTSIDQELKSNLDRLADTLLSMRDTIQSLASDTRSKVEANIHIQLDAARRHLQASRERADILEAVHDVGSRMQQLTLGPVGPNGHPVPHLPSLQLPAAPEIFHGREGSVQHVVDLLLKKQQARVFICGSGGIGKTSLALTAIHHHSVVTRFGDRRHWVPCDQAPTPEAFVQLVARSMEITITSASSDPFKDLVAIVQAGEIRDRLLILDNFETTWDTKQQPEVRTALCTLAAIDGISILMTTRDAGSTAFGLAWSRPLLRPLGQLPPEAAREAYLSHHPEAEHDELLDSLLKALDYYPLVITLMASQGALGESPSSLLDRWEDEKSKLLSGGSDKYTNLEVSMSSSINSRAMQENPDALQVLSILALLPAGTTINMLPQLPHLRHHIDTLAKVSLAYRHSDTGLVGTLSPIRAYILKQNPPDEGSVDAMRSVYDQLVQRWVLARTGSDSWRDVIKVLTPEEPNIESVFRYSMVNGVQDRTFTAIVKYTHYLFWYRPNPNLLYFALDHVTSNPVSPVENAKAHWVLGSTLVRLGNFSDAIKALQFSESLFKTTGNRSEAAQCQGALSEIFSARGRLLEAQEMIRVAEETLEGVGAQTDAARCRLALGDILVEESRYSEAKEIFQSALSHFEANGLLRDIAIAQLCLSELLQKEGEDYAKAEQLSRQALSTFRESSDKLNMAACLFHLGGVMYAQGRVPEAREYVESALAVDREIGHAYNIKICEGQLREWSRA